MPQGAPRLQVVESRSQTYLYKTARAALDPARPFHSVVRRGNISRPTYFIFWSTKRTPTTYQVKFEVRQ